MDDPWDVKSVRQSGQYISCMKINGIPLLPPVLSKECRKEMQYYKLLAKEVEKRISILQPYISTDEDSTNSATEEDVTPALICKNVQCEQIHYENHDTDTTLLKSTKKIVRKPITSHKKSPIKKIPDSNKNASSNKDYKDSFKHDLQSKTFNHDQMYSSSPSPPLDLPERDYNCTDQELLLETITIAKKDTQAKVQSKIHCKDDLNLHENLANPCLKSHDGPVSLGSKSFTGSLHDIYTESTKSQSSKLCRQSSYTLLKPSPQLLAHLEVQSLSTGVEMSRISMSESLSNLSSPNKKRRSWDLEAAKMKWSSMAKELQKNDAKCSPLIKKDHILKEAAKKKPESAPPKTGPLASRRPAPAVTKTTPKSDPIQQLRKASPVKNAVNRSTKESSTPKGRPLTPTSPKPLISECDDPATKVRELYDKIQKQQLLQMANLVEKQRREQMLLQQVFEEQNNLLFKQLKTICPTSPIEIKEAWGDKLQEGDRGPVSLSQLINPTSAEENEYSAPAANTTNYMDCSDSKNKRKSSLTLKNKRVQSPPPASRHEGSRTRTHSPNTNPRMTSISRRLNYDTSTSETCEPILTDRTNDTMADLNVTFPSDSDDYRYTAISNIGKDVTMIHAINGPMPDSSSTDSAIKCTEKTLQPSLSNSQRPKNVPKEPSPQQRAAATRIVAYARGYLVRRLMRTERVQTTVQTIRDALVCALQLHQDREGIRGADVDLHRRLIQQITAACYSLHDTFIASTPAERCAVIASDRARRRSLAAKPPTPKLNRPTRDIMSKSHCGAFPARPRRSSTATLMTQSHYESYNKDKCVSARYMPSPRRRPWR